MNLPGLTHPFGRLVLICGLLWVAPVRAREASGSAAANEPGAATEDQVETRAAPDSEQPDEPRADVDTSNVTEQTELNDESSAEASPESELQGEIDEPRAAKETEQAQDPRPEVDGQQAAEDKEAKAAAQEAEESKKEAAAGSLVVDDTPILEDETPAQLPSGGALGDATRDPRSGSHPRGGFLFEWNPAGPRWFVSARADVGFLFIRPRASVGYGLPHAYWAGLDVVPILSASQYGGYTGIRFKHPRVEFRSGVLYSSAFFRGSFVPKAHYDQRDLDLQQDDPAEFWASDSEFTLSIPVGMSFLQSETQALYFFESDPDRYVFVDTLGVIVAPPWAGREQVRLSFPIKPVPGLFTGPAVEAVWVPNRAESWTLRAGFVLRWQLYQDVQVRTDVLPNLVSPDTLGRISSPWLTITTRFHWATN